MATRSAILGLYLLLVAPTLSLDLLHSHRMRRGVTADLDNDKLADTRRVRRDSNDKPALLYSTRELGDKLKDLIDRDRSDSREKRDSLLDFDDDNGGFRRLFDRLDDIADHLPADLSDFDFGSIFGDDRKESLGKVLQNQCLRNASRLRHFFLEVDEVMKELREDLMDSSKEDITSSDDVADDIRKRDVDEQLARVVRDVDDKPAVTEDDDSSHDDDGPLASIHLSSHDDSKEDIDLDDIFEMLSEDSLQCVSGFLDDDDEKMLCQTFSRQSPHAFAVLTSAVDCSDYIERDDDLHQGVQRTLLSRLLTKPLSSWTSQDLHHALLVSPDAIDDVFLKGLSDDLFDENLSALSRLATRKGANPSLQVALRQRILAARTLGRLDSKGISGLGRGLLTLSDDLLDDLDPSELLNADLDDIFDDDDDEDDDNSEEDDDHVDDVDDDDDDDDDDFSGRRLAIGHRMMQASINGSQQLARVVRLLYDDLDFLGSVDADDLLEAVPELKRLKLDDDDAANLLRRVSQSQKFPALEQVTVQELVRLKAVLPGMSLTQLQQLPRQVVKDAVDTLKDIDFGESQARELLDDILDDDDDEDDDDDDDDDKPRRLTVEDFRRLGALARGLDADDIEGLDDDVVSNVLDDIDDLDLSDVQKRLFVEKARQALVRKPGAVSLLTLPGLSEAVSIDDINVLASDAVLRSLNVSSRVNWRVSQAAALMDKVKHSLGGRSLRPSDAARLGTLARGLLPRDLDDIVDRPDDVDDLADVLGDHEDELSSAVVDKMVEKIRENDHLDDVTDFKVTASYVAQKGAFLPYLTPNEFSNLDFDDDAKKAFLGLMSRMNTAKLPRHQIEFLADELLDMIDDLPGDDEDEASSRRLRLLGGMALGLTPDNLEKFTGRAILDNLGLLGVLPFKRLQALTVLKTLDDADPEWECKSTILARVGPLLQFADDDKLESICEKPLAASLASIERRLERRQELLEKRREQGFLREDTPDLETPDVPDIMDDATEDLEGKKLLAARMVTVAMGSSASSTKASGRRRRAAAGDLSCSVLRQLRQDVGLVGVERVTSMADQEFQNCLEFIGNATSWSDKDLVVLLARAKQIVGNYSVWTSELIRRAGVLVAGMSTEDIATLHITGVDALNSIGKHGRLSEGQLSAGFSRWLELKKKNNIAAITAGDFSSLSEFVCGLTVAQISELPLEVFKQSLDVVGQAQSCNDTQRAAYVSRAEETFGNRVQIWSPAVVGDMGHLIGALNSSTVQELAGNQLALIRPSVISGLPVDTVKALTVAQLKQLSTNQVNALRLAQYSALSKEQQAVLDTKATVAFHKSSTDVTTPRGSNLTSDVDTTSSYLEKHQTTSGQPDENSQKPDAQGLTVSGANRLTPVPTTQLPARTESIVLETSSPVSIRKEDTTKTAEDSKITTESNSEAKTSGRPPQSSGSGPQTSPPPKNDTKAADNLPVLSTATIFTSRPSPQDMKATTGNPLTALKSENSKTGESEGSQTIVEKDASKTPGSVIVTEPNSSTSMSSSEPAPRQIPAEHSGLGQTFPEGGASGLVWSMTTLLFPLLMNLLVR